MFVLEPIYQIFKTVLNPTSPAPTMSATSTTPTTSTQMSEMLTKLGVTLTVEERELTEKKLLKAIMRKFLPAGDALAEMIVIHLPSPVTAQKYRVETLYEGPLDDECAEAIRDCDPEGTDDLHVQDGAEC